MMDHNFIGIDIGSNKAIVSHLNRNVNQVLLDGTGDRETPVSVSYSEQQRLFGLKANMRLKSSPLSTVLCPQRFLTEDLRELEIQSSFNPAKFENQEFHLEGNNFSLNIQPKQVTTGFFNYLQGMTNNIPNNALTLSAISAPNHGSYKFKKQIYKCASAVIPNSPSIVSEKMAIGLDYLINTSKQKQTVLFIDFGHSKLTAYALKFTDESIIELTEGSFGNLGVRCLDQQLMKYFQSKIQFALNYKGRMKLRDIAAKTRLILSANSEYIINEDFGDNDFQCKITREQFEKICESPFNSIKKFIDLVQKDLIRNRIKIDRIQVFGGGSRIPAFQEILSQSFRLPIMRGVSNDALSRGCALYAHHKQKISKLGKIELKEMMKCRVRIFANHYQTHPIGKDIDLRKAGALENYILYEPGSYNEDKTLTLPLKNKCLQMWIVTEQASNMIEYYNFNSISRQTQSLIFTLSTTNGFPRVSQVSCKSKNTQLTRPIQLTYDCKEQIQYLRAKQLEFKKIDIETIQLQFKRNKVQSEIFRIQCKHPEYSNHLDSLNEMKAHELDELIKELIAIQIQ